MTNKLRGRSICQWKNMLTTQVVILPWVMFHSSLYTGTFHRPWSLASASKGYKIVSKLVVYMQDELQEACKRMQRANEQACNKVNKKRQEVTFEVGEFVWLRVKPNRYSRLQEGKAKLFYHYVGPFPIEKKILSVAY